MKQQDKLIIHKILIFVFIFLLISCKENKPKMLQNEDKGIEQKKENKPEINSNCFNKKDAINAKNFYYNIIDICKKDSLQIKKFFIKNIVDNYQSNFCSLLLDSFNNKEGEIEFELIENNCKGVISINSLKKYVEDGETYRDEYSLFLYIIKENDSIKINEIGGAG